MTSVRGLEKFIESQDKIIGLLNQEAQDLRKRFFSTKTILNVFCIISIISQIFASWFLVILFFDIATLPVFEHRSYQPYQQLIGFLRMITLFVSIILIVVLFLFPARILSLRYEKFENLAWLLNAVFFIPFCMIVFVSVLDFLDGGNFGLSIILFLFSIYLGLLSIFMLTWFSPVLTLFVPRGIFLIQISSTSAHSRNNHDTVVFRVIKNIHELIDKLDEKDFLDINAIAENKKTSLTGQLQSTAIVLTCIGLLIAIIPFIFLGNTENLFHLIGILFIEINQYFFGEGGVEEDNVWIFILFVAVILFIVPIYIIFISSRYFSYSYKVLRAIEIIQLICHSEITKAQQQENGVLKNINLTARLLAGRFSRSDKSSKPQ